MLAERMKKWPERWEQKGRIDDATIAQATGLPQSDIASLRGEPKH